MSDYFGKEVFKLGFGLMRLPKLEDGKTTDIEQVKEMVDMFIGAGGTYFDTAYVYDAGNSELAANEALVKRYPRDSYTIATKINASVAPDAESAKKQFEISLERLGCGYIDYYLLHAISEGNIDKYDSYGLWEFQQELQDKGLIKYKGFSFHGTPELLDRLLAEHPVDFIQLQINYADMENPGVQSRRCWEVARKHNVSVTVMEPVKGGSLANPHEVVKTVFDATGYDASYASWAIRYVASLDGIITVLSGMSNLAQMEDNTSYMKEFRPLSAEEQEVVRKAQEAFEKIPVIPCTACEYCVEGCPMQINIPEIFKAMNRQIMYNDLDGAKRQYGRAVDGRGKASECIQCGQCEAQCPQHINIIERLQEIAELLEV